MRESLGNYPGLRSLIEVTETGAEAVLRASLFQALLERLQLGRLEELELLDGAKVFESGKFAPYYRRLYRESLNCKLVSEFVKLGLSPEDALGASELFVEMAKKGELK